MALACEKWGCLPEPGSYLDQPAGLLSRMSAALNVYQTFSEYTTAENPQDWLKHRRSASRIIDMVIDLRRKQNG